VKIAIFSDTYRPQKNGVSTQIALTAEYLSRRHEVTLFVPLASLPIRHEKNLEVIGLPSLPVGFYPGYRLIRRGLFSVNNEFRKRSFDVIHLHTPFFTGMIGLVMSRVYAIPVVAHYHTFLLEYLSHLTGGKLDRPVKEILGPFARLYLRQFFLKSSVAIAPSAYARAQLEQFGVRRIALVPNCVDLSRFRPELGNAHARRRIIYVGRLSLEKRVDHLLTAFKLIDDPSLELLIAGDGPQSTLFRSMAKHLGLNNVTFAGSVPDAVLPSLYNSSLLFATASDSENSPVSILEAMACGKPIVATEAGGTPEVVADGFSGLLAKPNSPEDLASKIRVLLDSDDLLSELSSNSLEAARLHSIESTCQELVKVYSAAKVSWRLGGTPNRIMKRMLGQ
jgi:glycosyltransferase involved in cell wall biosynthesis